MFERTLSSNAQLANPLDCKNQERAFETKLIKFVKEYDTLRDQTEQNNNIWLKIKYI